APVERAGTRYAAELGYYTRGRKWTRIAASAVTLAPPDSLAAEATVEFATIPLEVPFPRLVALVKKAVQENRPLAQAVQELRAAGQPELPVAPGPVATWTRAQEKALAGFISIDPARRVWIGSLEITELIRRHLAREVSSLGAAQLGLPPAAKGVSAAISSPFG